MHAVRLALLTACALALAAGTAFAQGSASRSGDSGGRAAETTSGKESSAPAAPAAAPSPAPAPAAEEPVQVIPDHSEDLMMEGDASANEPVTITLADGTTRTYVPTWECRPGLCVLAVYLHEELQTARGKAHVLAFEVPENVAYLLVLPDGAELYFGTPPVVSADGKTLVVAGLAQFDVYDISAPGTPRGFRVPSEDLAEIQNITVTSWTKPDEAVLELYPAEGGMAPVPATLLRSEGQWGMLRNVGGGGRLMALEAFDAAAESLRLAQGFQIVEEPTR